MSVKTVFFFWIAVLLWAAAVWSWALTGYIPLTDLLLRLVPNSPGWAQFWASVIGLGIAIAVPAWLHIKERAERHEDRMNRARANAVGMRFTMLILEAAFKAVSRPPRQPLDEAIPVPTPSESLNNIKLTMDLAPTTKEMMPLMQELGPAAFSVQKLFDTLEQVRALISFANHRGVQLTQADVDELRPRMADLADLAREAKLKLDSLF